MVSKQFQIRTLKEEIEAMRKHMIKVQGELTPLGIRRLYGALGARKARLKELTGEFSV